MPAGFYLYFEMVRYGHDSKLARGSSVISILQEILNSNQSNSFGIETDCAGIKLCELCKRLQMD